MIRVINDTLGRMLHVALHDRMVKFAEQNTPEFPAEQVVNNWLSRMFLNDPSLHIIVDLDSNYKILSHAVIEVQEVYGKRAVIAYQVQGDKSSLISLNAGLEYIEKLGYAVGAYSIGVSVQKNVKAIEKKGYQIFRTVMFKILQGEGESEDE